MDDSQGNICMEIVALVCLPFARLGSSIICRGLRRAVVGANARCLSGWRFGGLLWQGYSTILVPDDWRTAGDRRDETFY